MLSGQIPEKVLAGVVTARIMCGVVRGVQGPVHDIVIDPEYLDVSLPRDTTFVHPIKRGHTAFAYVVEGEGFFDTERSAFAHEVVL